MSQRLHTFGLVAISRRISQGDRSKKENIYIVVINPGKIALKIPSKFASNVFEASVEFVDVFSVQIYGGLRIADGIPRCSS